MKVMFINTTTQGSTGRICQFLSDYVQHKGNSVLFVAGYGNVNKNTVIVKEKFARRYLNSFFTKLHGGDGFYNKHNTVRIIELIKQFNPDLINIHNLHGHYINIPMLFDYLAKTKTPIIITLHDCFLFTGGCSYYLKNGCRSWINKECNGCAFRKEYPYSIFSRHSNKFLRKKIECFMKASPYCFVSPSEWLSNEFKKSVLKEKQIMIINNGIDLADFSLKKEPDYQTKPVVLCSAAVWDERKGIDILNDLIEETSHKYDFIVLGKTDKTEINKKAKYIPYVNDMKLLSELYKKASVFFSPSLEDNYPTVLIESICSGTPVVAFDVGGTREIVGQSRGVVIKNKTEFEMAVDKIISCKNFVERCKADRPLFSKEKMCEKYYHLFEESYEKNRR